MTSPLRTCSDSARRLVLAALLLAVSAHAATVGGSVRLIDSRDAGVRRNKDFLGVVIWLERANGAIVPLHPAIAEMTQRGKHFVPPVLAIPVGGTVAFPNVDPIFHNAFSNFAGQVFDVGLYPPGTDQKVRFRRPGIVRVFCNIHPTMSAVIAVLNTPYMAVSAVDGAFRIDDVESGAYCLRVFHERSSEQTLAALERNITVGDDPVKLPVLEISESGYLHTPHKNKYGKNYPKVIEDTPAYPVGRKP
jgi:plastocyanin